ncbi:carbon-nitrogen hydrolase family protein [Larsenimonas rhizosphaerae]|uniref:Bifunctional GNAT family N-acetyltransferase/carbon-nitrogen hydrolase family protein n=1 Tax=Larsenimonas rhizosphaerae TaxID=2944682 RepID=A0AA41ZCB8_9GAMM|nr:bifunctional GNAT family N-acetyltransferase/carbon-nitrogen hydrolase family protein [Larsenimonas rhizosphaerae]MCM2129955.1 bifunctional GNAT family N-acetyltransferase/carbon-nitrogen hydrolase family protein [Larsenimonas rhizosphaerae]MCX2522654.1 bifunctional GNAT family N-acetyltransferase/carbon-nitrogen hydrolase family protein [Larsenimonas rhizosphaerae]
MSIEDLHLNLCNLSSEDYNGLKVLMDAVYNDIGGAWPRETIDKLISEFPDGQLAIKDGDRIIGVALTVLVDYDTFSNPHKYDDLIGTREVILHNKEGDALYGLDVLIDPAYRGYRLGRRLYEARKDLCRSMNLRAILAGGRIPNYYLHANDLSPTEYLDKVSRKEIHDPILSFQLANDFLVKRLLRKYLPEDERSMGYATLLEWNNILFEPAERVLQSRKSQVRVGAVQWQMREFASVEQVLQQVEFYVDAIADYQSDFAVLPELFNTPLMGLTDQTNQVEAIQFLAGFTERFKTEISRMAVSYNINIVAGSMVEHGEDGRLYNVSYLCHRDGEIEKQAKLHITPQERRDWVVDGGDQLQVFETDAGRVGILICYDVEFPELPRLLAEQDMDILFVPFWTDTKNSYLRVRHCAQARAIENECYVVVCGSVGNVPSIENLDIQYAQSAVFSPSDFSFPHDAVLSETTPNTEMVMFSDLDLKRLKIVRSEGSVTNLKDRRKDLFDLRWRDWSWKSS